ncbi:hypothetical protein BDV10DRAFT_198719 [Aspergillus recurvatus]
MSLAFCECHPLSHLPCNRCIFLLSDDFNTRTSLLPEPIPPYARAVRYPSTKPITTHLNPMIWDQALGHGSLAAPTYQQATYTSEFTGAPPGPGNGDRTYVQGHMVGRNGSMAEEFESNEALDTHVKNQHLSTRHALFY